MGNCNFKSDNFDDSSCNFGLIIYPLFSHQQIPLQVPLHNRQGWIWKGVEGGEEEVRDVLRDEGDVQGEDSQQEECQLRHEREEATLTA